MRVLCVYTSSSSAAPEHPLHSYNEISLGLSAVAASLRESGHDILLLVLPPGTGLRKSLQAALEDFAPGLVCISVTTVEFPRVAQVAAIIGELLPLAYVILGGVHPSLKPQESIALPGVDAICIGEGDHAVVELAAQLEAGSCPGGVRNLWIKDRATGQVEQNPTRPLVEDLDSLPAIDYRLWQPWVHEPPQAVPVLVGRGCPNRCTYCSNHALARLARGRYVRFRTPESVSAEIERLAITFPELTEVRLEAETLGVKTEYTLALADALAKLNESLERPLRFWLNLDPSPKLKDNRQLVVALKRAGFIYVSLGLESGSERLRRDVLRRPRYSNQDLIEFCALAREQGLGIQLWVLIGLPGETLADFRQTVEVTRACRPFHVRLSVYHPIPGTDLQLEAVKQGLIRDDYLVPDWDRQWPQLELPGFSRRQQRLELVMFPYRAFSGILPWHVRAAKSAAIALKSWPAAHSLLRGFFGPPKHASASR